MKFNDLHTLMLNMFNHHKLFCCSLLFLYYSLLSLSLSHTHTHTHTHTHARDTQTLLVTKRAATDLNLFGGGGSPLQRSG